MRHEPSGRPPSNESLSGFCGELSALLASGMILEEALALVSGNRSPYPWASGLADAMENGRKSFAGAVNETPFLPDYAKALVDAGERTGKLEEALRSLSDWYGIQHILEKKAKAAFLRPLGMLLLVLAVVGIIVMEILPVFDQVYAGLGGKLGGPAAALFAFGLSLRRNAWAILTAMLALAAAAVITWAIPSSRKRLSATGLVLFSRTATGKAVSEARAASAMAMGLGSGLNMDDTMSLAVRAAGSSGAGEKAENCRTLMTSGHPFVAAIRTSGLLDRAQCRVLDLAAKSGTIDAAMARIAKKAAEEAVHRIDDVVERIEPAIVLLGALLTGAVLFSVMLPMLDILSSLGV